MQAASPDYIVDARQLSKQVETPDGILTILSSVDLQIKRGESVAIVGASGSGKSTLLGLLAGLDEISAGSVMLAGQPLHRLNEDQRAALRSQRVGFVFQSFQLIPSLSALENVTLPLELQGATDIQPQAQRLLEQVGLSHRLHHYPPQLSGGEQQRVALARAFAGSPAILFADEPTGNLDSRTGQKIIDLLFDLNREHATTLVLVTHDLQLADRCQRCLRLDEGTLELER